MQQRIIILDFGSQYTQLIARRIRELNTYCEIYPYNKYPAEAEGVIGVIYSGSPCSVNDAHAPQPSWLSDGKTPLLGICYGAQWLAKKAGGKVESAGTREYGRANLVWREESDPLMQGIPEGSTVWMSHGDTITYVPPTLHPVASTADVTLAAFRIEGQPTWAVQFHPEVYHSEHGMTLLSNFLDICGSRREWTPASFVTQTVERLRETIGSDSVVLALSGGVDSTVAAMLLNRAVGKQLTCIFVDNGLLRLGEFDEVMSAYKSMGLNVIGVDAKEHFYSALKGVTDPERKRKIIGKGFIDIFERESRNLNGVKWLAQGTIYPDVIESLSLTGTVIKSHHNVGGLPKEMNLKLVEPLRLLFKDEVRRVGAELGISPVLTGRHPFPGPGLGVRILGDVTPEKVRILQEADHIFIQGLRDHDLYNKVWQAGAILLPVSSVGVMGDERTYESVVALRAVNSVDGMTAEASALPHDFLAETATKIIRKVRGVNRVVYDISSKPPATIEWE